MKKYFYTDGTTNFGPFTLEELKEKNISKETYIWFQGISDWKQAGTIPELDEIFAFIPPSFSQGKANQTPPQHPQGQMPPKTWLIESILATLLCCLPFGIAGIVFASSVESKFYAGDIEGAYRASSEAKKWTTISFCIGIAALILSPFWWFLVYMRILDF